MLKMLLNRPFITDLRVKWYFKKKHPKVRVSKFNVNYKERLTFKGYCYIGPNAFWSAKGGISIGNNVIFGPETVLWAYNHDYKSNLSIPYGGKDILKEIIIEDNVWIGMRAMVLAGVRVGEGSVVAAGSVVTKDVPPYSIVGGNPARVIKQRDIKLYEKLKNEKKLYLNIKYSANPISNFQ